MAESQNLLCISLNLKALIDHQPPTLVSTVNPLKVAGATMTWMGVHILFVSVLPCPFSRARQYLASKGREKGLVSKGGSLSMSISTSPSLAIVPKWQC